MYKRWDQTFYSTDSQFQLELNLQSVRRSLIQMIDDFEAEDCSRCRFLKCRCQQTGPTPPQSTTGSIQETEDAVQAPPATDLPHPDFTQSNESTSELKDVEAWVRTSTPNPDKTVSPGCKKSYVPCQARDVNSWPSATKSVWNDYKKRINTPEINTATVSQANSVQDFFNAFSVMNSSAMTEKTLARNRALMQKLKVLADKPSEYTYF